MRLKTSMQELTMADALALFIDLPQIKVCACPLTMHRQVCSQFVHNQQNCMHNQNGQYLFTWECDEIPSHEKTLTLTTVRVLNRLPQTNWVFHVSSRHVSRVFTHRSGLKHTDTHTVLWSDHCRHNINLYSP